MNISLERASQNESDLKAEIQNLQRNLMDATSSSYSSTEKLKQVNSKDYLLKNKIFHSNCPHSLTNLDIIESEITRGVNLETLFRS